MKPKPLSLSDSYIGADGQLTLSTESFESAIRQFRKLRKAEGLALAYNEVARNHLQTKDYPEALKAYKEALTQLKLKGDTLGQAKAYANIGAVHYQNNELAKAESNLKQSASIISTRPVK